LVKKKIMSDDKGKEKAKEPQIVNDNGNREYRTPEYMSTDSILQMVDIVEQTMRKREMIELRQSDKPAYDTVMQNEFGEFAYAYPALFKKVIGGNMERDKLMEMVYLVQKMHDGKCSKEEAESHISEKFMSYFMSGAYDQYQEYKKTLKK